MKILHTSDWHIGRILYGKKRYEEFEAFLNWLIETIQQHAVDVLLVAGDVFDTSAPSNTAQALYYRFLCRVGITCCRHVVVIAGNHDSPSFLNAPRELLKALDVHVVGSLTENTGDEVIVLNGNDGMPELIVCAVPYLRDRDIRLVESGESIEDKVRKLTEGIRDHYVEVIALAERKRSQLNKAVPIVAMGHLFTAGGQTVEGDGVRELYVGALAHVAASIFPDSLDYLALGHLHVPQKVNDSEAMRYSGSPLPMGFGEAKQQKSVVIVEFDPKAVPSRRDSGESCKNFQSNIELIPVPVFQQLERIMGDLDTILNRIDALSAVDSQAWLEVIYDGNARVGNLRERLDEAVTDTKLEILRIKNTGIIDRALNQLHDEETIDDMSADDVFKRCLEAHNVPADQQPDLLRAYSEIMHELWHQDVNER